MQRPGIVAHRSTSKRKVVGDFSGFHLLAWGISVGRTLISSSNTGRVIRNIYEAPNLS